MQAACSAALKHLTVVNEHQPDSYREWPGETDVVRCWWEQRVGGDRVQRVVPDGCSDIVVFDGGDTILVGPSMTVTLYPLPAGAHARGLRFRTEALFAALGLPGEEIRDLTLPLAAVLPDRDARRVTEAVWTGRFPEALRPRPVDARVRRAVRRLSSGARVAAAAGEIEVTERHLRRLLLTHTGIGPKAVGRVARFQRFLREAETRPSSLGVLAADAGYADQAHLSREVRELTGLTPLALLDERSVDVL